MINIDKTWTLFLDRDGVINERNFQGYILDSKDFVFKTNVLQAFHLLAQKFETIIIVTNQAGVGKKLMTQSDLDNIHIKMCKDISDAGGRVDKIYASTALAYEVDNDRKPLPQMAYYAKNDFPQIDFKKSIMVGDTLTDMQFGKGLNMVTVLILDHTHTQTLIPNDLIDYRFKDLFSLAQNLINH